MCVIGNHGPSTVTQEFMAWPTPGINPSPITPQRWSFTIPGANFSNAQVEVTDVYGRPRNVVQHTVQNGFGDNTLVWEMDRSDIFMATADVSYTVSVTGVTNGGETKAYSYIVTISDPVQDQDCGSGLVWDDANCSCALPVSAVADLPQKEDGFRGAAAIRILDLSGRVLFEDKLETYSEQAVHEIANTLSVGIYVGQLQDLETGKLKVVRLLGMK